eukprot:TRINITY_DN32357_c0_g1_i1.p1 TRINITY_DN32357_c0_g1~~TRINITY_DN32357_c0_g1_i1.p1  ORF type:complete len:803 (-),score=136.95 TRINITY_DN32357_c0_g1_i1:100-2508(-)
MGCSSSKALQPETASKDAAKTLLTSSSGAKEKASKHRVVFRIIGAELTRSFDTFGKMDPFVVAEHTNLGGHTYEFARTRADWGSHMKPKWVHTCRGIDTESSDTIKFSVYEKNIGRNATFCGEASAPVSTLLRDNLEVSAERAQTITLTLRKKDEETGRIFVQAGLSLHSETHDNVTRVSATLFEVPVKRMQSTKSYFNLKLKDVSTGSLSSQFFVGKDLSSANEELKFYEQKRKLEAAGCGTFEYLFHFMLRCEGVTECPVVGENVPRQMLVFEDIKASLPRDSKSEEPSSYRMLKFKLGQKGLPKMPSSTSRIQTLRQNLLDGFMSTQGDSFRVQAFEGQPAALESVDPLLDVGGSQAASEGLRKKARSMMLWRMPASDVFMHFLDMHTKTSSAGSRGYSSPGGEATTPRTPRATPLASVLSASEVAELTLSEIACKLVRLALACRAAPAPQDWNGSHLAIAFDAGCELIRGEDYDGSVAIVKTMDWLRSEITTQEAYQALAPCERRERAALWRQYTVSVHRLAWEATRSYWHRFGNSAAWKEVHLIVYDFDSMTANEYIGQACFQLQEMTESGSNGEVTLPLLDRKGVQVKGKNGQDANITCSVSWKLLPAGARLRGFWQICILSAANLPACDPLNGLSDPGVSLLAVSEDGEQRFLQSTAIIPRDLNPTWGEVFDLPLAASGSNHLAAALDQAAPGLGSHSSFNKLLPTAAAEASSSQEASAETAFSAWMNRLAEVKYCRREVGTSPSSMSPVAPVASIPITDSTDDGPRVVPISTLEREGAEDVTDPAWGIFSTCRM